MAQEKKPKKAAKKAPAKSPAKAEAPAKASPEKLVFGLASGPQSGLTFVTVPAGGSVQVDDGTHATVYAQNLGQRHVIFEPGGYQLRPAATASVPVTAGSALFASTSVGNFGSPRDDGLIAYQVQGTAQQTTTGVAGSGSPSVTTVASSGTSQALVLPAAADVGYDVTLTGNCTFSMSGGTAGKLGTITLILRQDATAGRSTTFPTSVNWPSQTAPTFNTTAGKYDVVQLSTVDGGTTWFGGLVASAVQPITAPPAPVSLAASPSTGSVVLTWADAGTGGSAITGHAIYRGTSSGTETSLTTIGTPQTYTDSAVTNGTTYYYKVAAVNVFGTGTQSAEVASTPGHYLSIVTGGANTPNTAGMTPGTSTIDLRALAQMASWVPSGNNFFINKWHATAANNQYTLYIDNAGKLQAGWYNAASVGQFAAATVATNQPANGTKWVRALITLTTGTVTFYLSDDGSTWTQLGAAITGLTTTAVQTPTVAQPLTIGQTASATGQFAGRIYKAQLLIGGASQASVDFTTATAGASTVTGAQAETWTVISPAAIV